MARARRAPFFQADLGVFGGGRLTGERPRKSWPVSTDDQNLAQQRLDAGFTATFSQRSLSPIRRSALVTIGRRVPVIGCRKKSDLLAALFTRSLYGSKFFAMLFKVSLSCIFGVLSGVSRLSPRILRMVRGFFVLTGFLVLRAPSTRRAGTGLFWPLVAVFELWSGQNWNTQRLSTIPYIIDLPQCVEIWPVINIFSVKQSLEGGKHAQNTGFR